MKKCLNCNTEKEITNFYKHNKMADGHLNFCKDCVKSRVGNRYKELKKDPAFIIKERTRGRQKFHRLYKGQPKKKRLKIYL